MKVKLKSPSRVQLFATPWTVAHQAPLSVEFPRQEYWSWLPFPSQEDLPDPGRSNLRLLHLLYHCATWEDLIYVCMCMLVTQLCLTLCDPMDCSPPGSSVRGILQAKILEWVAISFSRGSSQARDRTLFSRIVGKLFIR